MHETVLLSSRENNGFSILQLYLHNKHDKIARCCYYNSDIKPEL